MPLSHEILSLLLQCCDYNLKSTAANRNHSDYRAYLISRQEQLLDISIPDIPDEPVSIDMESPSADVADLELFRLASLIYLGRASDPLGQGNVFQWFRKALTILQRLDTYTRPFPLLIFGLEAFEDEQRMAILDIVSRTETRMPTRSLHFVLLMIQSIWIQDDLAGRAISYMDKLSLILSANAALPTFV